MEAIETAFVPVLIYNNRSSDASVLARFSEPAWNNPVVRYLSADAEDLIEREDGVWTSAGTVDRMLKALSAAKHSPPPYLIGLGSEDQALETATFAMHCFWEGESLLGSLAGVYSTRSAWRDGLEVVTLQFNPAEIEYEKLVAAAQSFECASRIFAHNQRQLEIAKQQAGDRAVAALPAGRATACRC